MGDLVVPLTALATAVAVLFVLAVAVVVRRFALSSGIGTFDCSFRRENQGAAAGGWVLGIAKYERDRLDWFRVLALGLRPSRSLARSRLVILDSRALTGPASYSVLPGWVAVRCAYGALTVEMAMSESALNGLAAWLESAPPGGTVYVA